MMDTQIGLYIVGIMIAALTATITGVLTRKRTDAESTDLITQAAERIVLQLQESNRQLHEEVGELRREVARLHQLIKQLGGNPWEGYPFSD